MRIRWWRWCLHDEMNTANTTWHSQGKSSRRIDKSTPLFQVKFPQLYFTIFIIDETWRHHFDPESKGQSMVHWSRRVYLLYLTQVLRCRFGGQSYGNCIMRWWGKCIDWLFRILQQHQRNLLYSNLIGKVRTAQKEKRREKSSCGLAGGCFTTTTLLLTYTGCHPKFRVSTALSPIAFTRFAHEWLLFVSETEGIHETTQFCWRRCCYLRGK